MHRGDRSVADPLGARRQARDELIALARAAVDRLSTRIPLVAAAIVGSVARGDFNVWSDVDVVVIASGLPARELDRQSLLLDAAAPGVQPVAFTPHEFDRALERANRLAVEAVGSGVPLVGATFFEGRRAKLRA
jgi:hypothetical protein